jgi:hypothetical protein
MLLAAILFSLTALGGLVLALIRLRGTPYPPTWLALGHGAVGVASFAALIAAVAGRSDLPEVARIGLWVLVFAALGGLSLFVFFHLRERPLPLPFVAAHGLAALIGVGLLWVSHFTPASGEVPPLDPKESAAGQIVEAGAGQRPGGPHSPVRDN